MPLTLAELYAAPKSLSGPVTWAKNGSDLNFVASLDLQAITEEGLFLRGGAKRYRPDRELMMQLEVHRPGRRGGGQLERVCWAPLSPHTNPNRGPVDLRYLELSGSHFHDFTLNVAPSMDDMKRGNLKIARPIAPEPVSFTQVIDFCASRFSINNMEYVAHPPWEVDLFGDVL